MISLRNLSLRRGPRVLLKDVNWTIFPKQRIGLIGANGSGKSSFFSLLLQELTPESGELTLAPKLELAHVAQETPAYSQTALDFVLDGDTHLRLLQQQLSQAETQNEGTVIAKLHEELDKRDAYTAPSRAAQLLDGLGFHADEHSQPVSAFSGGWRMRLNLAKALMCPSDLLLLDEPTNHLDLDAVLWLEQWLLKYPGTLLLISHDREFLDNVVTQIAHLAQENLKLYTGNYSTFEKQRATDLFVQQATYEKQQKQRAHLQAFVDRFRAKATKSRQAQSRLKAIERMEWVSAVHEESPFQFHFKEPGACPNPLIRLEEAEVAYGEKIVLQHLNLSLTPKDRIAILGPNGAGKSSLIKLLAGELQATRGQRETGPGLKLGYFAQHQVDHLQGQESALQHLQQLAPLATEQSLRTFLGGFDFCGDRVHEPIHNFSGGEKSRLALALLIWQQPNLLLLDEPTNHLDLEMRHALSIALQDYQGAVLLVSHDRFLVRTTVDQLLLVANGRLEPFTGDLQDYQKWLADYKRQKQGREEPLDKPTSSKKLQRQQNAKERELLRPLMKEIQRLEKKLGLLQQELTDTETALLEPAIYEAQQKEHLQKALLKQAKLKKELQLTEEAWLAAQEQLENSQ
jgi:ATP-binding cassette subfamily F protein 3